MSNESRDWQVDRRGVEMGRMRLGIRLPVEVKITAQRAHSGAYKGVRGKGKTRRHAITVSTYIGREQAGRAIWHELQHAAQRERYRTGKAFMADYRRAHTGANYRDNAFEVEADTAENQNARWPATRERTGHRRHRSLTDPVRAGISRIADPLRCLAPSGPPIWPI